MAGSKPAFPSARRLRTLAAKPLYLFSDSTAAGLLSNSIYRFLFNNNIAAEQAREELLGTFKTLLKSGDYSDFVITCGTDTYNVHKNVVCTRSRFLGGAERFTASQEATTAKADFSEDEPATVKLLVQYLYEGEYNVKLADMIFRVDSDCLEARANKEKGYSYAFPHTCETGCPNYYRVCHHHECHPNTCARANASQLLLGAKMYEIGDKYDVLGLKQLALAKFSIACTRYWNNQQFAPAAHYAFSTTLESDKGLRDIVTKTIAEHMEILKSPAVKALLNEFNGLTVGLLKMRAKDLGWI